MDVVGPGWLAIASALGWIGISVAAPVAMFGAPTVATLSPAALAGWGAAALAPAILILNSAAAAREARRARSETARLTALASEVLAPGDAAEARARRLGFTVRSEIGALQHVMDEALDRMQQMEAAAQRNALTFTQTIATAHEGAGALTTALDAERMAIESLHQELSEQTEMIGAAIGRQVRLMREAARIVRSEYEAADDMLQNHYGRFEASADIMRMRTEAIDAAAIDTTNTIARLDETMGNALDALAQATTLTDTARQSADAAAIAANATAGAVRETTQRAVADARRVAQMIRQETETMEASAMETLNRLRDAASEAHRASEEAQAAADKHAAAIQQRLQDLVIPAPAPVAPVAANTNEDTMSMDEMAALAEPVHAVAGGRVHARAHWAAGQPLPTRFSGEPNAANIAPAPAAHEGWTLKRPTPHIENEATRALQMLADAGVRVAHVLSSEDLDAIAQRARNGAPARRRAVNTAAPDEIALIRAHVNADADAFAIAKAFRAKPHLATMSDDQNLLVAYLLVDAAIV
jgi:hypothetical protein